MAVSEDRKFTKEQVYTLLEGAKGKTLGEVDLRPPEFVYPKENRNHPFSHLSQLLLGKNHVDDGFDYLHHLVVSIHVQQSLVTLALCHHSDYPDHTQHMVGMRMCNEEVMNIRNLNIHLLQLREDSVSSARIHQHQSAGSLEQKTGIINLGNRSISRSEHRNLIHLFAIFVMIHILFYLNLPHQE